MDRLAYNGKEGKTAGKNSTEPENVTFDDLRRVLEDYGFVMRESDGTSHHFFRAEIDGRVWILTIPYKRPHLNVVYVRKALNAVDEIIEWSH